MKYLKILAMNVHWVVILLKGSKKKRYSTTEASQLLLDNFDEPSNDEQPNHSSQQTKDKTTWA